jgi:hypothetical protein
VLLDEQVESVHLSSGHAAAQLVERIAWAISDAEDVETVPRHKPPAPRRRVRPARRDAAVRVLAGPRSKAPS